MTLRRGFYLSNAVISKSSPRNEKPGEITVTEPTKEIIKIQRPLVNNYALQNPPLERASEPQKKVRKSLNLVRKASVIKGL